MSVTVARNKSLALATVVLLCGVAAGAIAMRQWMKQQRAQPAASARDNHDENAEQVHAPGERTHGRSQHSKDEHGEDLIHLSPEAIRTHGIEVATAGPGKLEQTATLPGEVQLNADRVAHIVPRVTGMVREVRKNLGDTVTPGEVLAILDSRELADAKASDLAASSRHELAEANLKRIEKLFSQKIAPEEELLRARQMLAEMDIEHRTAEAKLHALGLSEDQVASLHREKDTDFSRYEIRAPFACTVIEKHLTLGEVVNPEKTCFVLADLSDVWVQVTVYPQDVPYITLGTSVDIRAAGNTAAQRGRVEYVSPRIDEATRTGQARVVLSNPDRRWLPGMFVFADVAVSTADAAIVVPGSALQTIDNQLVVFVTERDGFEKRVVTVGRRSDRQVEILSGLSAGDQYVASGSFILKAEFGKAAAEHAH